MSSSPVGDGAASIGLWGEMSALLLTPAGSAGTKPASLGDGASSIGLFGEMSCLLHTPVGKPCGEARQVTDAGDSVGLFGEINITELSLGAVGFLVGVAACDCTVGMPGEARARFAGVRSRFEDFVSSSSVRSMTTSDCLRFVVVDELVCLVTTGTRAFCIAVASTPFDLALLLCDMMNSCGIVLKL